VMALRATVWLVAGRAILPRSWPVCFVMKVFLCLSRASAAAACWL
jgi:hypothetical protein